jgi:ribosomal protein S18 acetylase RimI-like enzyme
MASLTFHSASAYSPVELSALFNETYLGYFVPVQLDAVSFQNMVGANDIDLSASRVALHNRRPVGIALLGIRVHRGWVGGMGIAPAQRGKGFGRAVMLALIDSARERKLRSIDLEVIDKNRFAIPIYEELGFETRRTLDIWSRESDATFPLPPQHHVAAIDVQTCLNKFEEWHTAPAPWQRDILSLEHNAHTFEALGVAEQDEVRSYVLYRLANGRINIVDIAAAPGHRTVWIDSALRGLVRDKSGSPISFVNLPQDDPAAVSMHRIGAQIAMRQYEMTLRL